MLNVSISGCDPTQSKSHSPATTTRSNRGFELSPGATRFIASPAYVHLHQYSVCNSLLRRPKNLLIFPSILLTRSFDVVVLCCTPLIPYISFCKSFQLLSHSSILGKAYFHSIPLSKLTNAAVTCRYPLAPLQEIRLPSPPLQRSFHSLLLPNTGFLQKLHHSPLEEQRNYYHRKARCTQVLHW